MLEGMIEHQLWLVLTAIVCVGAEPCAQSNTQSSIKVLTTTCHDHD